MHIFRTLLYGSESKDFMWPASRSYLLTIVDRRSGYLFVSKVGHKTSGVVRDASVRLLQKMKSSNRRTLTLDNGTESSCFNQIASRTGVKVYSTHPDSS